MQHFSGEYPPEWEVGKTCESWSIKTRPEDEDEKTKVVKVTEKLWRDRYQDSLQLYIAACPHCQHNRAWRIAQQIEQEAGQYRQG